MLVYDLGGGTFDLAVLVRDDGKRSFRPAIEPRGDRIGGEDFDRSIYTHLDDLARKKYGGPICAGDFDTELLRRCRLFKENLSVTENPQPFSWSEQGKKPLKLRVRRETFEELIREKVDRTVQLARLLQEDASGAGHTVDSIILIGGSSRIPLVQRKLHEVLKVEPRRWQKQDVAVALGAAYHANEIWGPKPPEKNGDSSTPCEAPLASQYRQAVETVWKTGSVSRDDLDRLTLFAGQLRMTKERAAEIERNVMSDFKEVIFDRQERDRKPPQQQSPSADALALLARAQGNLAEAWRLTFEASKEKQDLRFLHIEAGLQHAQAACDLEPNWADAFYCKGELLVEKGEWLLASAAFTACLQRNADFENAYAARGYCKLMAADYAGAKADFDESIKRWPKWGWRAYERRAVARLRLGDAASACRDLQETLSQADEQAPKAILKAMVGLITLETQRRPERAIPWFAEAIRAFAAEAKNQEAELFDSYCYDFGFADKVLPGDGGSPIPVVQRALWQACKAIRGGCTRTAVGAFSANNKHMVHESVWNSQTDFAIHRASLWAESGKGAKVVTWLRKILHVVPNFDVRIAMRDSWIAKCRGRELDEFFTSKWSHSADHNAFNNQLTITNHSPFHLHSLIIHVTVSRHDRTEQSFTKDLSHLAADAHQIWSNVFPDPGWFGGNIRRVRVSLTCSEGELWANLRDQSEREPEYADGEGVLVQMLWKFLDLTHGHLSGSELAAIESLRERQGIAAARTKQIVGLIEEQWREANSQ